MLVDPHVPDNIDPALFPLQSAIVALYKTTPLPDLDSTLGTCYAVTNSTCSKPKYAEYVVELGRPQSKVIWGQVAKESSLADNCGLGQNARLFVQYPNRTYVDPAATMQAEEKEREDDHVLTMSVLVVP